MKNKLFLLSIALIISGVKISHAADVVYDTPEAPVYEDVFSWQGAYIGAQAGYNFAKNSLSSDIIFFDGLSTKPKGFAGGLYAGYNWAFSNAYVFGLEGDINYADLSEDDNNSNPSLIGIPASPLTNISWNTRVQWEGAIRARYGISYNRWLPYIAGGVAFAGVKDKFTRNLVTSGVSALVSEEETNKTRVGYTIGAGVDYALTNNLLLRFEYRYSDYGKKKVVNEIIESRLNTNNVRLGIAYKF